MLLSSEGIKLTEASNDESWRFKLVDTLDGDTPFPSVLWKKYIFD